jgi:hypothetical protein
MDKTEGAENIDPQKVFGRAIDIITALEHSKNGNGLLITYDPDAEKFQFLAMHADPEEIRALLLSAMGILKDIVEDTDEGRVLN